MFLLKYFDKIVFGTTVQGHCDTVASTGSEETTRFRRHASARRVPLQLAQQCGAIATRPHLLIRKKLVGSPSTLTNTDTPALGEYRYNWHNSAEPLLHGRIY